MKSPTGVPRLDSLLGGGVPTRNVVLVYGPPYSGKRALARTFLVEGFRNSEAGVLVLTGHTARDAATGLAGMDADYAKHADASLPFFVDAYSRAVSAEEDQPGAEYVDGPMNLNAVALAVNNATRKAIGAADEHRLVIDSVSTLIAYSNAQTVFRFLQVLAGKAKRAGATVMLLLEQGMHADHEVQMFKHLADGIIELRPEGGKNLLRVQGVGVTEDIGWVEYRFTEAGFDVTGSFAAGRIR